jgi:hypothetical protein
MIARGLSRRFDPAAHMGQHPRMRPMTIGERQVLIDLAEDIPAMREEVRRRLAADNQLRLETERAARRWGYSRWRAVRVKRIERRRKTEGWLGPLLAVPSVAAFARVLWLMAGNNAQEGSWAALAVFGFLALLGCGMWLGSRGRPDLPPTWEDIARQATPLAELSGARD